MQTREWPLIDGLPRALAWSDNVGLLLDGVSVERLSQRIYQWTDNPYFEPLYLRSRWSELLDLSPCFIRIDSRKDPVLKQFLAHVDEEWGCLLFSDRPWREQVDHLRWLTTVKEPSGQEFLLRLADPAVLRCLMSSAEQHSDSTLFGPFKQVVTADSRIGRWQLSQRPEPTPAPHYDSPYRLSQNHIERLGEVSFRAEVLSVRLRLSEVFPAFQTGAESVQRWAFAQQLVTDAYARGFCNDLQLEHYADIHGLLGEDALQAHPDLNELLNGASSAAANHQLTQALILARARAQHLSGIQG
jgi:hypothetical protein